jgi:hypothetical protein
MEKDTTLELAKKFLNIPFNIILNYQDLNCITPNTVLFIHQISGKLRMSPPFFFSFHPVVGRQFSRICMELLKPDKCCLWPFQRNLCKSGEAVDQYEEGKFARGFERISVKVKVFGSRQFSIS